MTGLRLLRAGPYCTVQDAGRHGFLRFGITPAGPMDWIAHATANLLAGNPPGAAAVEIGPGGMAVAAEGGPVRLALSARGFRVLRQGSALPTRIALTLREGEVLEIAPGHAGLWAYLALPDGIAVPEVMGSRATHLRSGLGGRALAADGRLTAAPAGDEPDRALFDPPPPATAPIRVVAGPQDDHFTPEALRLFAEARWTLTPRSDRMAYRLSGPLLAHARGHDIVSDGIALGAVQVPGDGQPLVLMADRQPTGGYPKIATVIRADLPRLAQTRPGESLSFTFVPVEQAVAALRLAVPEAGDMRRRLRILTRAGASRLR